MTAQNPTEIIAGPAAPNSLNSLISGVLNPMEEIAKNTAEKAQHPKIHAGKDAAY